MFRNNCSHVTTYPPPLVIVVCERPNIYITVDNEKLYISDWFGMTFVWNDVRTWNDNMGMPYPLGPSFCRRWDHVRSIVRC